MPGLAHQAEVKASRRSAVDNVLSTGPAVNHDLLERQNHAKTRGEAAARSRLERERLVDERERIAQRLAELRGSPSSLSCALCRVC